MAHRQEIIDRMFPLDTVMDLVKSGVDRNAFVFVYVSHKNSCVLFRVSPWRYGLLHEEKVT